MRHLPYTGGITLSHPVIEHPHILPGSKSIKSRFGLRNDAWCFRGLSEHFDVVIALILVLSKFLVFNLLTIERQSIQQIDHITTGILHFK